MARLILVLHSAPAVDPEVPVHLWRLNARGRQLCTPLADALRPFAPEVIIASADLKAFETGQILATLLDLPFRSAPDLYEPRQPFLPEGIGATTNEFFSRPAERGLSAESADEAHARFRAAVDTILAAEGDRNVAVVAHGRVISLFVSRVAGTDPFALWSSLGHPSFVVLSLPGYAVEEVVTTVERV